jgi:integrative and conjugative element protein (TIGR02256 family)
MPLEDTSNQPWMYAFPNSDQVLEITPPVIQTFRHYRQTGGSSEAGGLLFARMLLPNIIVDEASHPHEKDKRLRFGFIPFRNAQRRLIKDRFKMGLHFIGEWHTHPQQSPAPSSLDLNSMHDSFVKSKHELNAFVMIIVGFNKAQLRLWVSIHDNDGYVALGKLREEKPTH